MIYNHFDLNTYRDFLDFLTFVSFISSVINYYLCYDIRQCVIMLCIHYRQSKSKGSVVGLLNLAPYCKGETEKCSNVFDLPDIDV